MIQKKIKFKLTFYKIKDPENNSLKQGKNLVCEPFYFIKQNFIYISPYASKVKYSNAKS